MKPSLQAGVSMTRRISIDRDRTIGFMGEDARVYATPSMIMDIERTCRDLIMEHVDAGEDSVGIEVSVKHLAATLPGMTIEIYGARSTDAPVSVQDPEWTHIATQLDVAKDGTIRLGAGEDKYRHLLIWITEGAPEGQQVSLGELKVYE